MLQPLPQVLVAGEPGGNRGGGHDLGDDLRFARLVGLEAGVVALLRGEGGHALAGPALDRFFVFISAIGYQWGVVPADILLTSVLLVLRRWREATFAGVSFAGSALLNLATKQFFQRDRPSLWESIAPEHTFSFPSGHAMGSATLAMVVLLLCWHTRFRWLVAGLAVLFTLTVGASRIYLGVHYPSDILGGWAAGVAWVSGVYLVLYRIRERPWQVR